MEYCLQLWFRLLNCLMIVVLQKKKKKKKKPMKPRVADNIPRIKYIYIYIYTSIVILRQICFILSELISVARQ